MSDNNNRSLINKSTITPSSNSYIPYSNNNNNNNTYYTPKDNDNSFDISGSNDITPLNITTSDASFIPSSTTIDKTNNTPLDIFKQQYGNNADYSNGSTISSISKLHSNNKNVNRFISRKNNSNSNNMRAEKDIVTIDTPTESVKSIAFSIDNTNASLTLTDEQFKLVKRYIDNEIKMMKIEHMKVVKELTSTIYTLTEKASNISTTDSETQTLTISELYDDTLIPSNTYINKTRKAYINGKANSYSSLHLLLSFVIGAVIIFFLSVFSNVLIPLLKQYLNLST
jgi:hypothetical protein